MPGYCRIVFCAPMAKLGEAFDRMEAFCARYATPCGASAGAGAGAGGPSSSSSSSSPSAAAAAASKGDTAGQSGSAPSGAVPSDPTEPPVRSGPAAGRGIGGAPSWATGVLADGGVPGTPGVTPPRFEFAPTSSPPPPTAAMVAAARAALAQEAQGH
jgi:hypothetical protein